MSGAALGMVLIAAFVHAGWNFAAKRVTTTSPARFVFLYYTVGAVVCLPFAAISLLVEPVRPQWTWLLAAVVTAFFHIAYGVVLQRGYTVGDLSVVYPLARGTGPLLSVLAAVILLGERPGPLGLVGALLVVAGVLVIGTGRTPRADSGTAAAERRRARRAGVGYGILTGATIAGYTLWDAFSVTDLAVPPMVYLAIGSVMQSLLLAPYALRDRSGLRDLLREHRTAVLLVGVLSPVAYVLVLFAMRLAPVSLVAPARELSIVLGGLVAWRVLGEADPVRRMIGSVIVLAGITGIALA